MVKRKDIAGALCGLDDARNESFENEIDGHEGIEPGPSFPARIRNRVPIEKMGP